MLAKFKMLVFLFLLLTAAWLLMQPLPARAAGPIYVDADAVGPTHDGAAWATAYLTVQDALTVAVSGDEIWVAAGVYYPGAAGNRTATFTLEDSVAFYGGFPTGGGEWSARDWEAYPTILSGDIDQNDINTDGNFVAETPADIQGSNTYHVLTGVTGATLDGFVITAGQANGSDPNDSGGGMSNLGSSPTLTNITFSGNTSDWYGGGMYNEGSSPTLTHVTFSGNSASEQGGGMYNDGRYSVSSPALTDVTFSGNSAGAGGGMVNNASSPTLTNVTFSDNSAGSGGGMCNYWSGSSPTLTNVTFNGNTAIDYGGGMSNWSGSSPTLANVTFSGNSAGYGGGMENWDGSSPTLTNVILWGNSAPNGPEIYNDSSIPTISYSIVQNGCPAGSSCSHLLIADPLFVDAANGNLRLQPTSPAIDAGNNAAVPSGVTTDLDGNPRLVDTPTVPDTGNGTPPLVDMGAYEAQVNVIIGKAVSSPAVAPGQAITFTLTFSNTGSLPATGIVVTDTLPAFLAGTSFAATLAVTDTGHTPYVWAVQDLAPGQSGVITVSGVLPVPLAAGVYTNTAFISAADDLPAVNNTAVVTFTVAEEPRHRIFLPLVLRNMP